MRIFKPRDAVVASLLLFAVALPVLAHHSFEAEFDNNSSITLKGAFTKIDWINPHIYFYMDVKDDAGSVMKWTLQSFPTGFMHRAGLTRDTFTIGEPVTVLAYRAKDGTKALGYMQVLILSSGRRIEFGGVGHPPLQQPK